MAWTTPMTWSEALVTVANMNTHVRDNLNYLKGQTDVSLTNKSGGNLTTGVAVIFDGSNNSAFTTTTVSADRRVIGVMTENINSNAAGNISWQGVLSVQVKDTVVRGEALVTSTTAGKVAGNGTYSWSVGVVGFALEGGTDATISALVNVRHQVSQQPAAGYCAYGYETAGGAAYYDDCEEYDPDTWTGKTAGPAAARYQNTFRGGGPLYSIMGTGGADLDDTDEYDPDSWTSKTASLATDANLYGGHAGYYGGVVAVHRGITAEMDEYDPDSWTNTTSSARALHERGSGVANNKMYEFGGSAGQVNTDEYDFAGTYTAHNDMPAGRDRSHGGAVDNDTCLSHGGHNVAAQDDMYAFDPNTWTTKTASGTNVYGHAMMDIGSLMYIAYGYNAVDFLTDCDEYELDGDGWTAKSAAPATARSLSGGSI